MDRFHPYIKPESTARRATPKCPPWATLAATKATNADGATVEGYLTLFPSAGQYEAMWSAVPETLNVRGDESVAGVMRIFARMTNTTLTSRGNPFWFENADGDAYDEPSVHDVVCTGGRARVVMKTTKYKPPAKAAPVPPPEPSPKAPAKKAPVKKTPAPKAPGKAEKPKSAATKDSDKPKSAATKGTDKKSTSKDAITGELYVSDARDKCRVTWSHTNRELVVPWTDTADGVLRIFAFMMGYKVGRAKGAIQCETRAGIPLPDPTMRQVMDAGKMVKVSMKQVKE